MSKKRLEKRAELEAAEKAGKTGKAVKKKAKKKAATRSRKKKADTPARRRLVWVVYSSTMREEGRYLYHERDKAEEKLNALLAKGKRRYFIQPIKESLDADGNPMVPDDEAPAKKAAPPPEPEEKEEAEAATADGGDDAGDDAIEADVSESLDEADVPDAGVVDEDS